jgi:hypothetical protein
MGLQMLPKWACPDWWPVRWEMDIDTMSIIHPVLLGRDGIICTWEWCVYLRRGWGWVFYFPHLLYLLTYLPTTWTCVLRRKT